MEAGAVASSSDGGFTPGFYDNAIQRYAEEQSEQVNLKKMMEVGVAAWSEPSAVLENARFLQRELPRRLARRLLDLQFLPYIVVINPNIKRVYEAYYRAFQTLRGLPPVDDAESNAEFTALLKRLVDEHSPLVESLAAGLRECKSKPIIGEQLKLDAFFNSMLASRISRRVLAEHHIALQSRRDRYVGAICTELDLAEAVSFTARRAQQVCKETYGAAPDVRVVGDKGALVAYIPTHLDYMLFELLKNAMRATMERPKQGGGSRGGDVGFQRRQATSPMPPVVVQICKGGRAVTLKISDQGGGIPEAVLGKIWDYGFTTAGAAAASDWGLGDGTQAMASIAETANTQSRMAGLGFGLPLSKLHARYFGGDLELVNVHGFGCDIYLCLDILDDTHVLF